jgi:hypothetical protein
LPIYRLIFPPPPGLGAQDSPTAELDSGDVVYGVGDTIEWDGKRWEVTDAPLEPPLFGASADLMVWPAEA